MKRIIIIGAGPAGLATAYKILKETDLKPVILEESQYIGGISRTHKYNDNCMDLGGHRFFTKNQEVMNFWREIFSVQEMPSKDDILLDRTEKFTQSGINPEEIDDVFLIRQRISRIYFLKKFFDYPLKLKLDTFINMGLKNLICAGFGYIFAAIHKRKENSLEDFYINRFGKPLYEMFFENYTEKLWGIHPSEIAPDWGAQRVKGLSLIKLLQDALLKPFLKQQDTETSLIEEFYYPKYGPGQFYEVLAKKIEALGGEILLNHKVCKLEFENNNIKAVIAKTGDEEKVFECDEVFSSMPVKDLVSSFDTEIPEKIQDIAQNLPYRDFMTAGLLVKKLEIKNQTKYKTVSNIVPDCWIYIQEKNVKLGRLQIFNNWSPYLVKNLEETVWLGLEYFCNEDDELWNKKDEDFTAFAANELASIGIIDKKDVLDATVIRVKKAYPAYFGTYKNFAELRKFLDTIPNLYCIGRNGQHRYNNMDHSILTGFEAAKAFLGETDKSCIWNVNTEKEYHETK